MKRWQRREEYRGDGAVLQTKIWSLGWNLKINSLFTSNWISWLGENCALCSTGAAAEPRASLICWNKSQYLWWIFTVKASSLELMISTLGLALHLDFFILGPLELFFIDHSFWIMPPCSFDFVSWWVVSCWRLSILFMLSLLGVVF